MHGNLWEWCEDDWHSTYSGAPDDGSAWVDNPRGSCPVLRGGGWGYDAYSCRSAYRNWNEPGRRWPDLGFRLAAVQPR